jgi:hypothetical protein
MPNTKKARSRTAGTFNDELANDNQTSVGDLGFLPRVSGCADSDRTDRSLPDRLGADLQLQLAPGRKEDRADQGKHRGRKDRGERPLESKARRQKRGEKC